MKAKIRVVIADEHRLLREGLRLLLHHDKGVEIVGEAATGPQTIDVISKLKPDVVLLDITMPGMDGIKAIQPIIQNSPDTKLLMISGYVDEATIFMALKAGVKGYLPKDAGLTDLVKAIRTAHRGELWIERKLMARFFCGKATADAGEEDIDDRAKPELTPREREVLDRLTTGCSNKEIAECLFISEKTVKSHLHNIFRKLNVTRRLQAILYAIDRGLAASPINTQSNSD
jgi:DNA-binding NarL/FixJ family response regulator